MANTGHVGLVKVMTVELTVMLAIIGTNLAITTGFATVVLWAVKSLITQQNTRFDSLDSRLNRFDSRMDRLDARLDRLDARLDRLDSKIDEFRVEMTDRIDRLNVRIDDLTGRRQA